MSLRGLMVSLTEETFVTKSATDRERSKLPGPHLTPKRQLSVLSRHTGTYTERPVSGRLPPFRKVLYSISQLVELRAKS
jgi:hypothetical protein